MMNESSPIMITTVVTLKTNSNLILLFVEYHIGLEIDLGSNTSIVSTYVSAFAIVKRMRAISVVVICVDCVTSTFSAVYWILIHVTRKYIMNRYGADFMTSKTWDKNGPVARNAFFDRSVCSTKLKSLNREKITSRLNNFRSSRNTIIIFWVPYLVVGGCRSLVCLFAN